MRFTLFIMLLTCSGSAIAQTKSRFTEKYPDTRIVEQTDTFFGISVKDPYRWLENDLAPETTDWVKRQNLVTANYLNRISYRNDIKTQLTELWNYEKYGLPFTEGNYTYYFLNNGLQNQSVLYREKPGGKKETFLDPNKFSVDGTTSLAGIEFSKDGSLAAYQISEGGSDWRKVIVVNTNNNKVIGDTLYDVKFSGLSWRGNNGFYYSSYDKPTEGSQLSGKTQIHKLFYHKLGTPQKEDKLVFGGEATPRRYINATVTENGQYLVIRASNATYGNELYVQDLSIPNSKITPIATGFNHEHNLVYATKGTLYLLTNLNAPNRRLVKVNVSDLEPKHWINVIAETKFPLSVSAGGGHFFARYTRDAVSQVEEYSLQGRKLHTIDLPALGTASGFDNKSDSKEVYYSFNSYVYPPTIFKYNIGSGKSVPYKKSNVKFDPAKYESKQVFYTSKDGTKIPMILSYKKGLQLTGKNPVMLYGYGGFNINLTPAFGISNIVLMNQGGIYAVANLRGGGEYGDAWHNAGTKQQKQNVFDDFIAAAEYLISKKYTAKNYLAISGGSNGGLLVGACMTQRPDLFSVCFPAVGVMDMLRYHKFTAGAGWAYDYGTAEDSREMFTYLRAYSPVHNLKSGTCYPATMVTTADHDDRVVPAHSFKFAAALQAVQSCDNPVLISIATKAGHGAGKPTSKVIEEQADKWSFMFYNMGIEYQKH